MVVKPLTIELEQKQLIEIIVTWDGSPTVEAVICLDSLAGGRGLRMHVSKSPTEGSSLHRLHQRFDAASKRRFNGSDEAGVSLVPKKINLGDAMLG